MRLLRLSYHRAARRAAAWGGPTRASKAMRQQPSKRFGPLQPWPSRGHQGGSKRPRGRAQTLPAPGSLAGVAALAWLPRQLSSALPSTRWLLQQAGKAFFFDFTRCSFSKFMASLLLIHFFHFILLCVRSSTHSQTSCTSSEARSSLSS